MGNDVTHSSDQLRILYTLYAVFFTLGLSTVYRHVPPAEPGNLLEIFLAAVITLVALRFIFVVEAFSRFLIDSDISKDAHPDRSKETNCKLKFWYVPILYFPFIFIHAFFFYRLCLSYATLFKPPRGSEVIVPQYDDFARLYVLLLGVNLIWLALLGLKLKEGSFRGRISFWLGNNFAFILPLLVAIRFFPGEINWNGSDIPIPFIVFMICGTGNSIVDLVGTARFYIPRLEQSDDSEGKPKKRKCKKEGSNH